MTERPEVVISGDEEFAARGAAEIVARLREALELIAAARVTLILAAGESKADIVQRALTKKDRSLPVTLIEPRSGAVCWVLNSEAASRLPS